MSAKRDSLNWLRMESRIRAALRGYRDGLDSAETALARIDTIVASETRRGESLSDDFLNAYEDVVDHEWNHPAEAAS